MRTTSSPFSSTLNEQPTPQYAHVVTTLRLASPFSMTDFSRRLFVGQACTQAPQETHSDSMKGLSPAETMEAKPRPSMVSAKVPWTSSHARTQREHTMHFAGSKVKYGFESSFSAFW